MRNDRHGFDLPGVDEEARSRLKNLTVRSLADMAKDEITEHDLSRASEAGYRRGFTQGFWSSMEASGTEEVQEIVDYYLDLLNWRYSKHDGERVSPPEPWRGEGWA